MQINNSYNFANNRATQNSQLSFKSKGISKYLMKNNKITKFLKGLEFDSFNMSHAALLGTLSLGVVLPRMYFARDEHEFKDTIYRDVPTIGIIIFAVNAINHIIAKICSSVTGFALNHTPKAKSYFKNMCNYLRPFGGVSTLNSSQIVSKYTNVDKYKEGIAGFFKFIDEEKGDVKKMFKSDDNVFKHLGKAYNELKTQNSPDFVNATNKDIIDVMKDKGKNATNQSLNAIYDVFRNPDNKFVHKAKKMNSTFNFITLFGISPLILGLLLPKIVEKLTQKRVLNNYLTDKIEHKIFLHPDKRRRPVVFQQFIS